MHRGQKVGLTGSSSGNQGGGGIIICKVFFLFQKCDFISVVSSSLTGRHTSWNNSVTTSKFSLFLSKNLCIKAFAWLIVVFFSWCIFTSLLNTAPPPPQKKFKTFHRQKWKTWLELCVSRIIWLHIWIAGGSGDMSSIFIYSLWFECVRHIVNGVFISVSVSLTWSRTQQVIIG